MQHCLLSKATTLKSIKALYAHDQSFLQCNQWLDKNLPNVKRISATSNSAAVKKINKIRVEKSKNLVANGEEPLEPYVFDYLLLCNKICGASHYNMQMKIVVETPEEFEKWMTDQQTFAEVIQ